MEHASFCYVVHQHLIIYRCDSDQFSLRRPQFLPLGSISALTFAGGRVAAVESGREALSLLRPHQQVSGLAAVDDPGADTELRGGHY